MTKEDLYTLYTKKYFENEADGGIHPGNEMVDYLWPHISKAIDDAKDEHAVAPGGSPPSEKPKRVNELLALIEQMPKMELPSFVLEDELKSSLAGMTCDDALLYHLIGLQETLKRQQALKAKKETEDGTHPK